MKRGRIVAGQVGTVEGALETDVAARALIDDEDLDIGIGTREKPLLRRDALAPSARARRLLSRFIPFVVRVFSFWDHRVTSMTIEDRLVTIDQSGSYTAQ